MKQPACAAGVGYRGSGAVAPQGCSLPWPFLPACVKSSPWRWQHPDLACWRTFAPAGADVLSCCVHLSLQETFLLKGSEGRIHRVVEVFFFAVGWRSWLTWCQSGKVEAGEEDDGAAERAAPRTVPLSQS